MSTWERNPQSVDLTADELGDILDALDYTVEATWRGELGSAPYYYDAARRYEALAESLRGRTTLSGSAQAVGEARLTDESVERAAWGIHESHDRGDWEHEPAEVLDEYLNMARAALTAALGEDEK